MNSLELPTPFQLTSDTSHWNEARRIYRRVCVLRALGRDDEATVVENRDLARVLATARLAAESDAHSEETAVLGAESERVANAAVLAELLAPLLADKLASQMRANEFAASSAALLPSAAGLPVSVPARKPVIATAPDSTQRRNASVPSITDLIDGMLSQEA